MPGDSVAASLDRLAAVLGAGGPELVPYLAGVIERNAVTNPGVDPIPADAPDAPERVDALLRSAEPLRAVERALSDGRGRLDLGRQLWAVSATVVEAAPT